MGNSKYQMEVDALSKVTSTIKIRGNVLEETDATVTLQVGNSLFEIPRTSISSMTDVESEGTKSKTVDVSIGREAKIIYKTLVTPDMVVGAITSRRSTESRKWNCFDCAECWCPIDVCHCL